MRSLLLVPALLIALAAPARADDPERDEPLLAHLERAFSAAARGVTPSIVSLEVERETPARAEAGQPAYAVRPPGPVTGVAISTNRLLTSAFNVEGAKAIHVIAPDDGRRMAAKLLGKDESLDLALIELLEPGTPLVPAAFVAGPRMPTVGTWLIAVGRGPSVNAGIVSALGRFRGDAFQTDAALNYGNYGGAAVDIRGNLVGICVRLSPRTGVNSGVGFVIPAAKIREALPLLERGQVRKAPARAFLGVQFGKEQVEPPGVEIARIVDGSAAAAAGLERGDLIRRVERLPVVDAQSASEALQGFKPGDVVRIEIAREGRAVVFEVTLGERPVER